MTLSTTIGVLSKKPALSPVWNVHARFSRATLAVVIWSSVEYRVAP